MTNYVDSVISVLREAAAEAPNRMTADVRSLALKAGWPRSAAMSLTVTRNGDRVEWDGNEEAKNWEYGGLGRTPSGVVRKYINSKGSERAVLEVAGPRLKDRGLL